MKNMRKLFALALAIMMVMSLATTAFAAEANLTGHTYKAYQIFTGTQKADSNELAQVDWGTGINPTTFLAALKASTNFGEPNPFADCETAADVADAMKGWSDSSDNAKAFAALAYDHKTGDGIACENGTTTLDAGYYLVVDVTTFEEGATDTVYNTALLQLTQKGTFEIANKTDIPEVEKKIVEDGVEKDENEVSIGDTINYKITGTLPTNLADYDTYYYVFTDTLSKGLTYTNNLKVTVNGVDVTEYFYVDAPEANEDGTYSDPTADTTITVGIQDLLTLDNDTDATQEGIQYLTDGENTMTAITKDTQIVITYTAVLNENANIGTEGNKNDVDLEYSNDPNDDGDGNTNPPDDTPDEPNPTVPTGKTPKDEVWTYTTEVIIKKVDEEGNALDGAQFTITGEGLKHVVTTGEVYVPCATTGCNEAHSYLLKDGTYTTESPVFVDNDTNDDVDPVNYEYYEHVNDAKTAVTVVYHKETQTTIDSTAEGVNVSAFVADDGNGNKIVKFTGLGAGTYTIEETVVPAGYNKIDNFTVEITWDDKTDSTDDCTWTYKWSNDSTTNTNTVTIVNQSGSTLPETGGMGTTLFYVFGSVMVLAAVVLLVTKRRMAV